jgi:hypothetical protein
VVDHDRISERIASRAGAAALSSIGLGSRAPVDAPVDAPVRAPVTALDSEDQLGEAKFAVSILAGSLGGVYCAAGATLLGRLSILAAVLSAIGLAQAGWVTFAYRGSRRAVLIGCALNAILATTWLVSRTTGLPFGGGRQPLGLLDAFCAFDSAVIAVIAASIWSGVAQRPSAWTGRLSHVAVLLAVLTVSALLGGHTHTAARGATLPGVHQSLHLYCRLL